MQLVMLSGNSMRNQDWIYEAQAKLGDIFDATYVQNYAHWESGNEWIDLPHELDVLSKQTFAENYGIFAKSIGTVLTAQALEKRIIQPKFLLFCGLPLGYIESDYPQFAQVVADTGLPLTIIHNQQDKVGSAEAVRAYLGSAFAHNPVYNFIETPGDTHEYLDYDLLRTELIKLRGDA